MGRKSFEQPPRKSDEKEGEVIFADFKEKKIIGRSKREAGENKTLDETESDLESMRKFKKDFVHWLEDLVEKMKHELEEADKLLDQGGPSHIFHYENYKHLKNNPSIRGISGRGGKLHFAAKEIELFEKIESHELLFEELVRTFFKVKDEWENALKETLPHEEGRQGNELLVGEIKRYLDRLKLGYREIEKLEEHEIVEKLEKLVYRDLKGLK